MSSCARPVSSPHARCPRRSPTLSDHGSRRVTADPNLPCGRCPECQRGAVNQCLDLAVVVDLAPSRAPGRVVRCRRSVSNRASGSVDSRGARSLARPPHRPRPGGLARRRPRPPRPPGRGAPACADLPGRQPPRVRAAPRARRPRALVRAVRWRDRRTTRVPVPHARTGRPRRRGRGARTLPGGRFRARCERGPGGPRATRAW